MEYETRVFSFLEKFQYHSHICYFDVFSHTFMTGLKFLNLYMSRFEWTDFININFMILFLVQN